MGVLHAWHISSLGALWGTLRLKQSKAFLHMFSQSQSQWGDGLHCALQPVKGWERGKEDGKEERSSNEQDLRYRKKMDEAAQNKEQCSVCSGGKVCDCVTGACIIIQTPQVAVKVCRHFPTL